MIFKDFNIPRGPGLDAHGAVEVRVVPEGPAGRVVRRQRELVARALPRLDTCPSAATRS